MIEFISENKEWLFSGIAAFVIGVLSSTIASKIKSLFDKKSKKYKISNVNGNESIKDAYMLDFLSIEEVDENELESQIINNLIKMILELSNDFIFVGKKYNIGIGSRKYTIDLVFYNRRLKSNILIEFKKSKFKPEFKKQMLNYIEYFDRLVRSPEDKETIGIIIYMSEDNFEMDFLQSNNYLSEKDLPELDELKNSLINTLKK